ncbi:uracil-DNA glycosylase-like protein [Mycena belliarum]|uniref:Uracil-DNA glycosylase n=1 Tax=Mycena belliarum TaxID=1033014 RepID=A0AAD6U367_9AGAR|nr:uracil-DNA glycosylase-like protein [Mycena belliae]
MAVYLEDLPVSMKSAPAQQVFLEDLEVVKKPKTAALASEPTTGKRQRTLLDMAFSDAPKRQKLAPSTSTLPVAARFTATKPAAPVTLTLVSTKQKLSAIPFSLSGFIASLPSDDARALLALECDVLGKSWLKLLADELRKPYFLALKRFLLAEGVRGAGDPAPLRIYPAPKDIYAWSATPLGRVKVVILGQDPYPGAGQAHGLSFSVPPGVPVPASLQNIYKELRAEYPAFAPPAHGHLAGWAAQGVLLLNAVLTVRAGAPASHAERGWEAFTERVLRVVDAYGGASLPARDGGAATGVGRGVVVLAWGAQAARRVGALEGGKHLVLKSAHPSPKSADRGFFGNGHFRQANAWLEARYGAGAGVDWCKL